MIDDEDEPLHIVGITEGPAGVVLFNADGTIEFRYLIINAQVTVENLALAVINTLTQVFELKPNTKETIQ